MRLHIATILAFTSTAAAFTVTACGDDDDAPSNALDGGADTSVVVDTGAPDSAAPEASGPDANIDIPLPTITCSVAPCAVEIASAGPSTCVRIQDGTVRCWGSNDFGQLGHGPLEAGLTHTAEAVVGLTNVVQLAAGNDAYCALLADGAVKCWGNGGSGQLGPLGDSGATSFDTPRAIEGLPKITSVGVGDGIACATPEAGDAICWGSPTWGRIPAGIVDGSTDPVGPTSIALGGKKLAKIAPGPQSIVALGVDHTLVSWGRRSQSAIEKTTTLGREAALDPSLPSGIPEPAFVTRLVGWGQSASAANGGGAFRWGAINGLTGPVVPTPVTFGTVSKVQDISIGASGQFCAILDDATARCVGDNTYGQLGTGTYDKASVVPVKVAALPAKPARIVTTYQHACAILENGATHCWGANTRGQLGSGDFAIHPAPTPVRFAP